MTRDRNRIFISKTLFYVVLAIIFIYIVFPFYWAFRSSVSPDNELFVTPVHYWPNQPTFQHYQQVLGDGQFQVALRNSTIVAVSATVLSLVVGTVGAYALGRFRFTGRLPVMYLILSMTMFPSIAILGALFDLVRRFGLYNNLLSLVITYLVFSLPFTVWVLTSFFQSLPKELEEAAYVDGASPFQTLYKVMLPLVAPGMVTTGLLAFIAAWNEFLFAVSFTQTPDKRTVPLAIFQFATTTAGGYEVPWGQIMAATVIVTIPLIILVLIFQNRIISGLTAGAVKG
ncbi:MAG TPA: carbohydrate ABC transporter permease [Chloroflexota bacterium]|jgi:trehalose/maltose transport system permease protein|nr:carbohydrate ABC transporter permease [Chloroflexota bacterium]